MQPAFLRFWRTDITRDRFLEYASLEDRQSLRLVSHEFSHYVAPHLFSHIKISFGPNTFTRPARMAALGRIGYSVRSVSFDMPHTPDTFLPPVIDPNTGEEHKFFYDPQLAMRRPRSSSSGSSSASASSSSTCKYGSWEMNDLLVKQYPPLFHAATNVSSFIRAFTSMSSLRHLKVSCPGQPPPQRYRRSIVDYTLISLRIALERAPLVDLSTLSLSPIHAGAVLYLRPHFGIGTSPASTRRWHQIKTLDIVMDSFDYGPDYPTDHLKILHTYLQSFKYLESFTFRWNGCKGPSPLSLPTEPCLAATRALDGSSACPTTFANPPFAPLRFRHLQRMFLENGLMDASQIAAFIMSHRKVLREYEFEDVHLRRGTWDEALEPLTRISGGEEWKRKQEEVMDVPLILSPAKSPVECVQTAMWEDPPKRRALQTLRRASLRTKEMLGAGPEHVRKLLRSSVLTWR